MDKDYHELLRLCRLEIEKKIKFPDSKTWTHSEFGLLSKMIEEETSAKLSENTLKRIWGKIPYEKSHNLSTLNVLARFAGKHDWYDFRKEIFGEPGKRNSGEKNAIQKTAKRNYIIPFSAIVFSVMAVILLILFLPVLNKKQFTFEISRTKGEMPLQIHASYDIGDYNLKDDLFIRYLDQEIPLNSETGSVNITFFTPGIEKIQLLANDKILSEKEVFITTKKWKFIWPITSEYDVIPLVIDMDTLDRERLYLSPGEIGSCYESLFTPFPEKFKYWVNYVFISEKLGDGEDYIFETRVKNSKAEGGFECRDIYVTVIGEHGFHELFMADQECVSMADVYISEKKISGLYDDLSILGEPGEDWNIFHYECKNKHFEAFVNSKKVIESDYEKPIGKIIGFRYRFRGTGSVDWVSLKNTAGDSLYFNDF